MLTPAEFPDFFRAVQPGRSPFPWQQELVRRVYEDPAHKWPEVIDVPTGMGKTCLLDVALFLAAALRETAWRRVFFVVDRRIVVDEAYEHAKRIQQALRCPSNPVAAAVSAALRQAAYVPGDDQNANGDAIEVTRMRGGVTWDARWVQRPDQYAIITGTVDQIGSRLLFRGYGVTEEARPIDAALVGTDSLIIIDEAHLARPMMETIEALRYLDSEFDRSGPVAIQMSATHSVDGRQVHSISRADENDPVAGPRLRAGKALHLIEVRTTRAGAAKAVPDAMARLALALAGTDRVVGVVANTVARARAIFERVHDPSPTPKRDAVLLTGRSRPVDREHILDMYYHQLKADRSKPDRPLVLVATQTIEVGADIDLDALITESAPLDSLVQRLGRLNRRGTLTTAPALVVHDLSVGDDDPVYGPCRRATWSWLAEKLAPVAYSPRLDPTSLTGGLDASPLALRTLTANHPAGLLPEPDYTPVLPAATLDAWVRTSPAPEPDTPIEHYLHGLTEARPPVRVVWRIGLPHDDAGWTEIARLGAVDALERVPPTSDEEIEVPLVAARRWLEYADETPAVSDHGGELPPEEVAESGRTPAVRYRDERDRVRLLRVRGRGDTSVITSAQISPGDLIVVPVEYGGCDRFGWNPASTAPVIDVADLAGRRGRPVLRVGPHLRRIIEEYHHNVTDFGALDRLLDWAQSSAIEDPGGSVSSVASDERAALLDALRDLATALDPDHKRSLARTLNRIVEWGAAKWRIALWGADKAWFAEISVSGLGFAADGSANASSVSRRRVRLDGHQRAVAGRARAYARNLRLGTQLERCVELAGLLHDEGKRDPRFQAMLWGGHATRAEVAEYLLAKSGMDPTDRAGRRQARRMANYPDGMRHEALSAQIAAHRVSTLDDADADLVIHLVAAHHGHSRPLLPPVTDPAPHTIVVDGVEYSTASTVDWSAPARFARLNQTYGRWGLARLEAIVRLADMWCSARAEESEEEPA